MMGELGEESKGIILLFLWVDNLTTGQGQNIRMSYKRTERSKKTLRFKRMGGGMRRKTLILDGYGVR